jgi:hypothetical protein
MWNWLKPHRKQQRQPKVWVLREPFTGLWSKVVAYEQPSTQVGFEWMRIGPLRSEMDAEEFCDRNNRALVAHVARLYGKTASR